MCNENKLAESVENQRSIDERLLVLETHSRYHTKLLESILEAIPNKPPNNKVQDMLKVQMGALRPLFEKANFEGKDQILSMLDNLLGGKV